MHLFAVPEVENLIVSVTGTTADVSFTANTRLISYRITATNSTTSSTVFYETFNFTGSSGTTITQTISGLTESTMYNVTVEVMVEADDRTINNASADATATTLSKKHLYFFETSISDNSNIFYRRLQRQKSVYIFVSFVSSFFLKLNDSWKPKTFSGFLFQITVEFMILCQSLLCLKIRKKANQTNSDKVRNVLAFSALQSYQINQCFVIGKLTMQ